MSIPISHDNREGLRHRTMVGSKPTPYQKQPSNTMVIIKLPRTDVSSFAERSRSPSEGTLQQTASFVSSVFFKVLELLPTGGYPGPYPADLPGVHEMRD